MLDNLYWKTKMAVTKCINSLKDEKGSSEVIALVIIIGIVVVLGFLFKDEIMKLFQSLWNNLVVSEADGNASSISVV